MSEPVALTPTTPAISPGASTKKRKKFPSLRLNPSLPNAATGSTPFERANCTARLSKIKSGWSQIAFPFASTWLLPHFGM